MNTIGRLLLACLAGSFCLIPSVALGTPGIPVWTNHYNGVGNSNDVIMGLAVDSSGNAFVTGSSKDGFGRDGYATIKYSSSGLALWTNRYDGQQGGNDGASGIALDSFGSAYVTGSSDGSGTNADFITIKYSSGGAALWTNRFNSTLNRDDFAVAIVTDTADNAYVTGVSDANSIPLDLGEIVTIAYSSLGTALWTNRVNSIGGFSGGDSAADLTVDDDNVYVTGRSITNSQTFDILTIAYTRTGMGLWTNRFSGPGNGDDYGRNIITRDGNVYVAGFSYGTQGVDRVIIAYSSGGTPLWTNRFNFASSALGGVLASKLAVDGNGNILCAGNSNSLFAGFAYSSNGIPLWTNYPGVGYAVAVAADADNHVFLAGALNKAIFTQKFGVVACASNGLPLWTNIYSGTGNGSGTATQIAVDNSDNVFVAGSTDNGGSGDYALLKFPAFAYLKIVNENGNIVLRWTGTNYSLQSTLLQAHSRTSPALPVRTQTPLSALNNSSDSRRTEFRSAILRVLLK